MADYNAGDLNLSIQTISNDTIKSLDAVIERLNFIQKGLGSIGGFSRGGNNFIRKSTSDGNKITKVFGTDKKSRNNGGLLGFAKLGVNLYMMRRLGRFVGELVQAGSDYNETLNLWQVAMRNNLDVADEFVNKMQKAYGISSKTLMNAQAVFKNMIGSLGQISDETAYALSEALVQMSVDYASLYNRTLESAFQNMQSMLAGQVRPIRSAGLDITETTLYQYYQQIGGTKSMRQLTRTEKQLLSILSVYEQMGSAGALGDMTKTLNEFANQSRMMTEYWAELKTWSGLLIKDLIDQSGILVYVNALLITATEIIKAIAKKKDIGDTNYLTGLFETAEATNEVVDELQGKLLDFDKFRSLKDSGTITPSIDDKLIERIKNYSSAIDEAKNKAQELADNMTKDLISQEGFLTAQGKSTLYAVGGVVGFLLSLFIGAKASADGFGFAIARIIGNVSVLALGLSSLTIGVSKFISAWKDMTVFEKVLSIIGTLIVAIGGLALAFFTLKASLVSSIAFGAGMAGLVMMIISMVKKNENHSTIPNYAIGASDIDSGTVFRAGEFGKTEAVYTGSNGKTNVANVRQMEQAFYNALSRHSREGNGTIVVQAVLDGEVVYENTTSRARARGQTWAKA